MLVGYIFKNNYAWDWTFLLYYCLSNWAMYVIILYMSMRLLSPAGDFECLKMAIFYGADEVYLGVKDFNARNNIQGFDLESLKRAVDFAHLFNVKVHLTVNILFSDNELQNALDLVVSAYNFGVDAFIVQDVGLASVIHKLEPQIELHASTQMGLHNLEGVQVASRLGFKRVVLSRETPLSEIKRIKQNTDVEIEYFAQGALCVSFSGNCYASSYLCDASGNRGKCKQLCRLPYTFEKDGKVLKEGYLLSAKDFNMIDRLSELQDAGVDAIKLEGRARRPFYVAVATNEYRSALDGQTYVFDNLKLAFNRNYTAGYFDGNGQIISQFQSHTGLTVGKIEKINFGKKFNEVFVRSSRKLNKKSTFKIFENGKETAVLTAFDLQDVGKDLYRITTTQKLKVGSSVNLILDNALEEKVLSKVLRKKVNINVFAKENEKIKAVVSCDALNFEFFGVECKTAKNQPLSEEEIAKNFAKSEFFDANVSCELGCVFLTKQELNEFRRSVFEKLEKLLVERFYKDEPHKKLESVTSEHISTLSNIQVIEKCDEKMTGDNIIYSPEVYVLDDIRVVKEKCEKSGKEFYLDTPNFALEKDIQILKDIIEKLKVKIVANNLYAFSLGAETVVGGGLNVFNRHTAKFFETKFFVSEGEVGEKIPFPYMTLRHCPMKSNLNATCANCPYCDGYFYRMQSGKVMKLKRKKLSSCTFYLTD